MEGKEHNFDVYDNGSNHGDYDYGSIMHYSRFAFSKNNLPTIEVRIPPRTSNTIIGQRDGFSQGDIEAINDIHNNSIAQDLIVYNSDGAISTITSPYRASNKITTHSTKVVIGTEVIFQAGNLIEITGTVSNPFIAEGTFIAETGSDICQDNLVPSTIVDNRNSPQVEENSPHTLLKDLNIFPNPTNGKFLLTYHLKKNSQVAIKISDLHGQTIKSLLNEQQQKGSHQQEYNFSYLAKGTYLINIVTKNETETRKIIIQ